jgi:hypothetical protein
VKLLFQNVAIATPLVEVNICMAATDDALITVPTGKGATEL